MLVLRKMIAPASRKAPDHRGVARRKGAGQRDVAAGRREVADVQVVLHRDRDAVQGLRTPLRRRSASSARAVSSARGLISITALRRGPFLS